MKEVDCGCSVHIDSRSLDPEAQTTSERSGDRQNAILVSRLLAR